MPAILYNLRSASTQRTKPAVENGRKNRKLETVGFREYINRCAAMTCTELRSSIGLYILRSGTRLFGGMALLSRVGTLCVMTELHPITDPDEATDGEITENAGADP